MVLRRQDAGWGWAILELAKTDIGPGERLEYQWQMKNTTQKPKSFNGRVILADKNDNEIYTVDRFSHVLQPGQEEAITWRQLHLCDDPPEMPWQTKLYMVGTVQDYPLPPFQLPGMLAVGPFNLTCTTEPLPPPIGCYVATAVYGDYDHPTVVRLRAFRDRHLPSPVVRTYYAVSPRMVRSRLFTRIAPYVRKLIDLMMKVVP